jgi:hypothetical protein
MARKSQHSLAKMGKVGRKPFLPDLKEWKEACEIYVYDKQIFEHFFISRETFYRFLDNQRCLIDEGKKSAYIDAYTKGRNKSKQWAISLLKNAAEKGDTGSIIFSSKAIGGLLEAKDIAHIELKKIEVSFKTKQFLTDLANKFNLNYEQLNEFANKFFHDPKMDEI